MDLTLKKTLSKIDKWTRCQKSNTRKNDSLESIGGWEWTLEKIRGWDGKFRELQHYKEKHGDCLVPRTYPDNP
jgi:hypothetical protein